MAERQTPTPLPALAARVQHNGDSVVGQRRTRTSKRRLHCHGIGSRVPSCVCYGADLMLGNGLAEGKGGLFPGL